MKVHLLWQTLLLVVCALLAFLTLNVEKVNEKKSVVILDAALTDVQAIEYSSDDKTVVVTPQDTEKQEWIVELKRRAIEKKKKPSEQAGSDGGTSLKDGGEPDTRAPREMTFRFPASKSLVRSIEKLLPISAKRELGTVDTQMREVMGFEETNERLLLSTTKGTHKWTLGDKTYGNQGRYAMADASGVVYLLPMAMLRGFEGNETRLAERKLFKLETSDIESFVVTKGDVSLEFKHHARDQINKRYFARADMPEVQSEDAKKFVAAVRMVKVARYVEPSDVATIPRQATILFNLEGGETVKGEFLSDGQGDGYLSVAPWVGELKESIFREILDDLALLMP